MSAYTLRFTRQALILSLDELELEFSLDDGSLCALRRPGEPDITGHGARRPGIDVSLADSGWLSERSFARYLGHSIQDTPGGAELVMRVGLGPLKIYDRYRVAGSLIIRRISIENAGDDELALCGVRLALHGACVGRPERCRFEAPANVERPRLPIASLSSDGRRAHWADATAIETPAFALAPSDAPGLLALHNDVVGETLACWYVDAANPARPRVEGDGAAATLLHEIRLAERLGVEVALSVGTQFILLECAPWLAALPRIRRAMARGEEAAAQPPDWLADAAIVVTHPAHYGGYRSMINALDDLRRLGYNTICLLPVHDIAAPREHAEEWPATHPEDLYALRSFAALDATAGDIDALRAFVQAAHARNLRVLLDLPLSGCAADSPYVADHPDWFCRERGGQFIRVPIAGDVLCFDWRNADLRALAVREAVSLLERADVDGYRVLVARNLPPGWPSGSAFGGGSLGVVRCIAELHAAIHRVRPAAALLSDLAGPLLAPCRDLAIAEAAHYMFIQFAVAGLSALDMANWLRDDLALVDGHALRACYTESRHSSVSNPLADALRGSRASRLALAGMVCCGYVPLLRAGQEENDGAFIARLLLARARSVALRHGTVEPGGVRCNDPSILTILRRSNDEYVVGLLNAGPVRRQVTIELPIADLADGVYVVDDLLNVGPGPEEAGVTWKRSDLAAFSVTLAPFATRFLRPRLVP